MIEDIDIDEMLTKIPQKDRLFIEQLRRHLFQAISHANEVNCLIHDDHKPYNSARLIIMQLDHLIDHAARASQIIYPSQNRGENQKRALRIRQILDLPELASDALQVQKLRNHLQHFDERIDSWAESSTNGNYADIIVGPRDAIHSRIHIMRHFIPNEAIYRFEGQEFDIQSIIDFCVDILNRRPKLQ